MSDHIFEQVTPAGVERAAWILRDATIPNMAALDYPLSEFTRTIHDIIDALEKTDAEREADLRARGAA